MYQHLVKMNRHSAAVLLLLLLCSDILFNLFHIIQHTLVSISSPNYIWLETSLEIYHLIKLFWIVVLFIYLLKLTRFPGYISWLLVFIFILIDDAFLLHQKIGFQVAEDLYPFLPATLRLPPRFFEIAVLAVVGFIVMAIVAWTYFHSSRIFRKISQDLLIFILALVFFGAIVDLVAALSFGHEVIMGFVIIEDGGEMVVLSLILWYIFLLAMRNGNPDLFLLDSLVKH